MISYRYPSLFFRKEWHWFEDPKDIPGVAVLNFFSYKNVSLAGFKKKAGLTTIIDLTQPEEVLWENMRKKFIREQINKGYHNGIQVKIGIDWRDFARIYTNFRETKLIGRDNPRIFMHTLVVGAYHKGRLIAGGSFIHDDTNVRALSLASLRFSGSGKMREIIGQANRLVLWETMRCLKERGFLFFDLGGINPESGHKVDQTLAEFKEGFGGVRQLGYYYTKVNSPLLKLLLRFRRILHL